MFFLKQKNFTVPVMQHIGCNAVPLLSLQHVSYAYTWRSLTPCFTSVISGTQLWIWNLAQILTLCSVKCLFKVNSISYYTVYCLHYLTIFCSVEFCPICQALLFLNPACPSCRSLSIHVAAYIIICLAGEHHGQRGPISSLLSQFWRSLYFVFWW